MAQFQNAFQNFRAGVVSPRYAAAVGDEFYSTALREGKNWIISSQGGAMLREGMEFIGYSAGNQPFRIFQYQRGGEISDLLVEVNAGIVRFWLDNDGEPELYVDLTTLLTNEDTGDFLTDEDTGAFISLGVVIAPNPYSVEDLDDLYFTNQDKYGIIVSRNHPPYYITQRRDGSIGAELLSLERIPLFAYNDTSSPRLVSESADWRVSFPVSWTTNQFVYNVSYNNIVDTINYSFNNDPATGPANNAANIQLGLERAAANQGYTTTFLVTAIDLVTYDITVTGPDSGWPAAVTPAFYSAFLPIAIPPITQPVTGTADAVQEPAWSYPTVVFHNDRYYECIRVHRAVAAENEPGVGTSWDVYWTDLGIAKPEGYDYQYPTGNAWADTTIYAPAGRGFPAVCVFHEQRLILMSNPDNPTAIYGSGIGEYTSFVPGPNDDQPFLFILDSSDTPEIKWARSQTDLMIGTSSGEWRIGANVTITPTDISAEQQNFSRAKHAHAVAIEGQIFYIEQGKRKLKGTRYVREFITYQAFDAGIMAEHLISTEGVNRLVASYIPETVMTMVRNNGQPLWMALESSIGTIAVTECETDGFVYDVASYFTVAKNREDMYFATQRNNNYVLERMKYPTGKVTTNITQKGVVLMDSYVTGTMDENTIYGLEHLEGKQVGVLLDDAWQIGEFTVQAGRLVLDGDYTGRVYAVGLLYQGYGETFEGSQAVRGVALGTTRRWNELYTRMLNSARPRLYGRRPADRTPKTPMDKAETVLEGVVDLKQTVAGYGDGSIIFVQDRPYPTHILGFFGEYTIDND